MSEMARATGGIERTTWDDAFYASRLRNRQVRDLVIPLALMLLLLHLAEIRGRRLLIFAAANAWLRGIRLPRLPRRVRGQSASVSRGCPLRRAFPAIFNGLSASQACVSPLTRAKTKARNRMRE